MTPWKSKCGNPNAECGIHWESRILNCVANDGSEKQINEIRGGGPTAAAPHGPLRSDTGHEPLHAMKLAGAQTDSQTDRQTDTHTHTARLQNDPLG